jgi:hypothetical protein
MKHDIFLDDVQKLLLLLWKCIGVDPGHIQIMLRTTTQYYFISR